MFCDPEEFRTFLKSTSFELHADRLVSELKPGYWMEPDGEAWVRSKFGGLPDLPANVAWPESSVGRKIEFLVQVCLSECDWVFDESPALPNRGMLLFFYDFIDMQDGELENDPNGWRVIFVADEESCAAAEPPELETQVFPEKRIRFVPRYAPPWELFGILSRDDEETDDMGRIQDEYFLFGQEFLGNPCSHQSHPGLSCHAATTGDACEGDSPETKYAKAQQWVLLAQVNSDETELGWEWYAAGSMYFMIHHDDLANLRFERAICICQCS